MAYIFQTFKKDGRPHPKWRFEFVDWKGQRRKATGTTSKVETEKLAARVEAEHALIRKGLLPPPRASQRHRGRAYEEVVGEYLAWGESQGGRRGRPWGKGHARMRRAHLAWWGQRLGLETLADLEGVLSRVERALRELQAEGRAGKTLSNYAEALHGFCAWCRKREFLDVNPLEGLGRFDTTPRSKRRALTGVEIGRLLAAAPEERRLLYEVAFCTGLRAQELRSLSVGDLSVEGGGLVLHAEWTKNRKPGLQPLPEVLVDRLRAFAESETAKAMYREAHAARGTEASVPEAPLLYVPSHTARSLDMDLRAAGVAKWTEAGKVDFHACRVAYVSLVLEAGAGVKEARELARHRNPDLTMDTYGRTREERLASITEEVGRAIFGPEPQQSPNEDGA